MRNSKSPTPVIRDAAAGDEDFILALNAACMPAVSPMDVSDLADLRGWAKAILIAEAQAGPCGFIILVAPGTTYDSDNYGWFEERFTDHLYIDRICVESAGRGQGAGRALYAAAEGLAREAGLGRLTCEVNVDPPNPDSMAFHQRLGFRQLHVRPSGDTRPQKIVAMLERPL